MEALSQLISLDEDAMRLLLDEIPVGVAIAEPVQPDGTIRPDARITFFNKKWTEMFGFDATEVKTVGQNTRRLYPDPDVHAQMLRMRDEAAGRIREGGRSEQKEIRAMGAAGKWLDIITGTTVIGDRLVVTMLDITERKRTARMLEETRRSLEAKAFEVTENMPAGAYTMVQPADGGFARFAFLSSRFLEMCEITREEAEQDPLNVYAMVHPEEYDEFLRKNIETFEGKLAFSEEFRAIIRGETRWFHAASNPRPLPDGSTLWEGVLTDITDRKLAENKLRDALMNLPIPVAVGTKDEPSRILLVNHAFTGTFGYTHEDIPTVQRWIELAYPDPAYRAEVMDRWQKSLHSNPSRSTGNEVRIHCKDGSLRDAIFSTTLTPDGPIVAFQDITAEKMAANKERELSEQHRRDLEAKLKTSLNAAAVAHEINQPLSAILLDSQMALERIKGSSPELEQARAFLSSTISNAERTVDTIGKMMSLLRSVQTTPHDVNLVDVVRSAQLYAKDDLRRAHIDLSIKGAARAARIRGDEGQLLLAVSNLLRNAIEALSTADKNSPRRIFIELSRRDGSVVLSVGDSGPGLPEETLSKIPLHTTKPSGTGLGLFIVQAVADNHGATLEAARSELGGAELRLIFPAAKN